MTETNVLQLSQPGTFSDPLTDILRDGARTLLAQAVEAEVAALLDRHAEQITSDGRQRLVRHGHLPEREIMTGIGPVAVRCPRVRDRDGEGSERIRFSSAIFSTAILSPTTLVATPGPAATSVTTSALASFTQSRIALCWSDDSPTNSSPQRSRF